jgi:hypothetical protein
MASPVGEGVWRHIDNAHGLRACEVYGETGGLPEHGLPIKTNKNGAASPVFVVNTLPGVRRRWGLDLWQRQAIRRWGRHPRTEAYAASSPSEDAVLCQP